jgi:hypothetical protein
MAKRGLALLFTTVLISVTTLLTGMLPATANGTEHLSHSAVAPDALGKPPGYTIVSQSFTATSGTQTPSIVRCPGNEVPLGGGVYVTSTSVLVNVNTSRPLITGNGWVGDVNNDSTADSGMTTYAICADQPAKYRVVQETTTMGRFDAVLEGYAAPQCTGRTVILGGGTDSSSFDLHDNINTSQPLSNGWESVQVSTDNENPLPTVTSYAICAKAPLGYNDLASGDISVPNDTQGQASAYCPGKSVPISGGGEPSAYEMFAATFYPSGPQSWKAYYNNVSGGDGTIEAFVICAK